MEPRPATLTLALALLLTANRSLSLPTTTTSPLLNQSHLSSPGSTHAPSSPSTIPPPPPPSPPPPPPPPLPPTPPPPTPPHSPPPPPPHARSFTPLSAKPNDAQDPPGRLRAGRPPGPCRSPGCPPRWPQHRWSGGHPGEPRRHVAPAGGGLNVGKKVGLSFLAAIAVLQVVLGGCLIYSRWRIGNVGYERGVGSSSPSASASAY